MSVLLNEIMRIKRLDDERQAKEMPPEEDIENLDNGEDLEIDGDMESELDEEGDDDLDMSEFDDLLPDEDGVEFDDDTGVDPDFENVDDEDLGYGGDEDEYGNKIVFDDDKIKGNFEDDEFTELEDDPNAPRQLGKQQQNDPNQQARIQFDDGDEDDTDDQVDEEPEDPNRAGVIRYVKGAHLVYKREEEDGTYTEMWIYNSGKFKDGMKIKKAILAGTDIPPGAAQSPDGAQEVEMWSAGNADVIIVTGLQQ